MSREIAVNSEKLNEEVETMSNALQQLKTKVEEAYKATKELDSMWDGSANRAFQADFSHDRQTLIEICDSIENLINAMRKSRVEYETCELDVRAIVESIKI